MKKFFLFFVIIILIIVCVLLYIFNINRNEQENEERNRTKLADNIYVDLNSIEKNKISVTGWFKEYNSDYNPAYDINVYYELIKYEADCKEEVLDILHSKLYNKKGKLLKDEPDNYDVCAKYSGYINGEIYFNALCKKTQNNI